MDFLTLLGVSIGIGMLPFDRFFPWMFRHIRRLSAELDGYSEQIFFSKAPIQFFLSHLCHFLKGYLLMRFSYLVFSDLALLVLISLLIVTHVWTPFTRFRNRYNYLMVFWGIYTFMYLPMLWILPLLLLLLVMLMNSVTMAVLLTSVLALPILWFQTELVVVIPVSVVLTAWLFLILHQRVFSHFESQPENILAAFGRR